MSRISCPHCQQHIECDPQYAGAKINCPSCQGEMVVPQPPSGSSVRLTQSRPTPPSGASRRPRPARPNQRALVLSAIVALLLVAGLVLGLTLRNRDRTEPPAAEAAPEDQAEEIAGTAWTMDLQEATIPGIDARGLNAGASLEVRRAMLMVGGVTPVLSLRSGANSPHHEILLRLPRRAAGSLDGQRWTVTAQDPPGEIKVIQRWGSGAGQQKEFDSFALKLELGHASGGTLPGKIYLALPDPERSYVAGHFRAALQVVAPQTTTAPPPPQADKPQRGPASVILKQRAREFGGAREE